MPNPGPETISRLENEENIWFGSIRPDGKPHLAPVWFVYVDEKLYLSTDPKSVKARNIHQNPHVVLALEDGLHPVICEGTAGTVEQFWPEKVIEAFQRKYDWDITQEKQYNLLVEVTPAKWLAW